MVAVETEGLRKTFPLRDGSNITAVAGATMALNEGEVFAFVGPDGAGKTTLLRMMCGLLKPTDGSVRILGLDMKRHRNELKHRIGYLPQKFSLYPDLSVDENIAFFAEIHSVDDYLKRRNELLEFTRLTPFRERLAKNLSGGMKQKLALACTLVHQPDVIFLDEPTTGVDPVSRRDFWKILSDVVLQRISIIVTTPYLDEAERCGRVALIHKGEILEISNPVDLKRGYSKTVLEVEAEDLRKLEAALKRTPFGPASHLFGDRIHIHLDSPDMANEVREITATFGVAGIHIRTVEPSLEDVFIARVGEHARTEIEL